MENNYNDLFPQVNPQDTEITPKTTNSDEICSDYSFDYFEFENQFCDEDLYDYYNGNYL